MRFDEAVENATPKNEYVIWGVPNPKDGHGGTEQILVEKPKGQAITDINIANEYVKLLKDKYGCTKVRIQKLDLNGDFDWMKETGLKKR